MPSHDETPCYHPRTELERLAAQLTAVRSEQLRLRRAQRRTWLLAICCALLSTVLGASAQQLRVWSTFKSGEVASAAAVMDNFELLKEWIEAKVGSVSLGYASMTSPAIKTPTITGTANVERISLTGSNGSLLLKQGASINALDAHGEEFAIWPRTNDGTLLMRYGSNGMEIRDNSNNLALTLDSGGDASFEGTVSADSFNGKSLSGTGLSCQLVKSSLSGGNDDDPTYAKCPTGTSITGCSCHSPWKGCSDGAYAQMNNNRCVAFSNGVAEVRAYAVCCSVN